VTHVTQSSTVQAALRNIVFRFEEPGGFARALSEGDQELVLPAGEGVGDGEWVLAIFETGEALRATAAAARGLRRGAQAALAFERRDWERLVEFAIAEADGAGVTPTLRELPRDAPTQPSPLQHGSSDSSEDVAAPPSKTPSSVPSSTRWRTIDPLAETQSARVLLVDDDPDVCEVVRAMLEAVGLRVESALSAEEALERVRVEGYDLLVLDWNLPGMTGIDLCRFVRGDTELSALPVLFLTAHASSRDLVDAFASGADDYVVKPFRAPELGARIFSLLRRARMAHASP
jgi:two-component system, OmpR family, phosphate regulon response regulator PhoB